MKQWYVAGVILIIPSLAHAEITCSNAYHFVNPIFDTDFPDPGVVRGDDGYFYVYGTQSVVDGDFQAIQAIRSKDLIHWERIPGGTLPQLPDWGNLKPNSWAPDVAKIGDLYVKYYTAENNETHSMALAVAVSKKPEGPFKDIGHPLRVGPGFEDIDPHFFQDDNGRKYLYWGSGFRPIRAQELSPDGLSFLPGTEPQEIIATVADAPDGYERLHEAPWIVKRNGWYIMFYSGDDCFGLYEVRVARSRSPLSGWQTLGQARGTRSSAILSAGNRWKAPGHNAIIKDDNDKLWILYHAIDETNRNNPGQSVPRRPLLLDPIEWTQDDWPYVPGGVPSETPQVAPYIRR